MYPLLTSDEVRLARYRLGLTLAEFAALCGLSEKNGKSRVMQLEAGTVEATGPVSNCIRFALAAYGLDRVPKKPDFRRKFSSQENNGNDYP